MDPYKDEVGLKMPGLKANAVILSNEKSSLNNTAAVTDEPKVLTWPGEYEVSGIAITAMELAAPEGEKKDTVKPMIYTFDAEGMKVCYISDYSMPITDELMETIGDVDVLVVPVGKEKANYDEIHKTIEEIEPRIVIPIYYKTAGLKVDAGDPAIFLKKAGLGNVTPREKFSANSKSELPQEKTEFVVLAPQTE